MPSGTPPTPSQGFGAPAGLAHDDPFAATVPAGSYGGQAPFGGAPVGGSDFVPTSAPVVWLFAALGVAVVGLAAALLLGDVPWVAIVAWVLGGPVCIGLTTVYSIVDTSRRTQLGYGTGRATLAAVLYWSALAIGLAAVIVAAVHLAFWAGRGF